MAAAMLAWPSMRSTLMARLPGDAITRGAFPVLTRDLSAYAEPVVPALAGR